MTSETGLETMSCLWYRTAGVRSLPELVLLHGFTGTHKSWAGFSRKLANKHFLIMPDLPGHGKSRIGDGMDLDSTSDSILRMLDRLGVEKTVLLGYSLGGRIALNFALKHQERLSSLILESASPGIQDDSERGERREQDEELATEIETNGLAWFIRYWEDMPLFATQKGLAQNTVQKMRKERLSNTAKGLAASLRLTSSGRMRPLWNQLGYLDVPVLLIVGEKDKKFLSIGQDMQKQIRHSILRTIGGAGHTTHLEKPDEFLDIVERFLDAHSRF